MATDLPKYMREVLGFSFYDVGLYTSVPWFVAWIVANLSGILCDLLINRGFLTPVRARKIFTGICKCWQDLAKNVKKFTRRRDVE